MVVRSGQSQHAGSLNGGHQTTAAATCLGQGGHAQPAAHRLQALSRRRDAWSGGGHQQSLCGRAGRALQGGVLALLVGEQRDCSSPPMSVPTRPVSRVAAPPHTHLCSRHGTRCTGQSGRAARPTAPGTDKKGGGDSRWRRWALQTLAEAADTLLNQLIRCKSTHLILVRLAPGQKLHVGGEPPAGRQQRHPTGRQMARRQIRCCHCRQQKGGSCSASVSGGCPPNLGNASSRKW